ncbi:unnamed protein product [Allacma fusca]|uniref:Uncharacterized protein n=1 Tax=Allacma fusca TaxID=39272 RepID=A0A8J2NMU2_9HEXA|nr:unnamed protein product [Allacma fusca]
MEILLVTNAEVQAMVERLENRYGEASRICGIQRCHAFKPISGSQVEVRVFSSSERSEVFSLFEEEVARPLIPAHGSYVAVEVNRKFQLGIVHGLNLDGQSVDINFMQRSGSRNSFSWPRVPKIDSMELYHLLGPVEAPDVTSTPGRMYKLGLPEFNRISEILANHIS